MPTPAATPSAPPPRPPTALPSAPVLPRWQNLTPEVRRLLLAPLTRIVQQHFAAPNASAAREVADDCC